MLTWSPRLVYCPCFVYQQDCFLHMALLKRYNLTALSRVQIRTKLKCTVKHTKILHANNSHICTAASSIFCRSIFQFTVCGTVVITPKILMLTCSLFADIHHMKRIQTLASRLGASFCDLLYDVGQQQFGLHFSLRQRIPAVPLCFSSSTGLI